MRRPLASVVTALWLLVASQPATAELIGATVASANDLIYVSGREVRFEHLGISRGEPVVRVDDSGLTSLLQLVGAKIEFQPGTRFIAFTRAGGKLVTFAVGSNAVSVDDGSMAIPFGPFYQGNQMYVPLLALSRALGLSIRTFRGGYAFVPQILSVQRRIGQRRTIVEVQASAPLAWRATFHGQGRQRTLVFSFPGFASVAGAKVPLGGREANVASIEQRGPPGYPTTWLTIDVKHGVKFASHRAAGGSTMDLILAREQSDLTIGAVAATPSVQISQPGASPSAPASVPPSPSPTPSASASSTIATAVPAPEVTDNSAAGSSPAPGASPSPTASGSPEVAATAPPLQKITDVFVTEATGASRVTLALTGPVTFEWHRLADPDNRFWIDISEATLIGPEREFAVKLPVVRSVKLSQHELTPNHVVRLTIDPTQPVDVLIGAIAGSPNQLGIEIRANPPPADAPASGVGALPAEQRSPRPVVAVTRAPTQANLIIIDPGHGGNDPGAMNTVVGLTESHLTLAIAQRLKTDLQRAGWRVTLTRDGDYEVGDPGGDDKQELQSRCDIANAAGARLFISVHINSSFSSSPSGITTYFWRTEDRAFAQAIQAATVQTSGAGDAGVRRENFYVIHHTFMPAVLIETAYLSNAHDAALLVQAGFIDKLADGIARGVRNFTGSPPAP